MAELCVDYKLSIGQRVTFSTQKTGTLRYKGLVSFSPGIWCGIELDEPDGENDGTIDNVRYFSCKKNHGHFCHVSEIIREPSLEETDFDVFSESFNFSELSIDPSTSKVEGKKWKAFPLESSDDTKDDESDNSLGIMDLDVLLAKSSKDEETTLKDMLAYDPFTDDFIEDIYSLGYSPAEQEKLNVTKVISSPEKTNLNVTQVISSPEEANLNVTQVIDSSEKQRNLNVAQTTGLPTEQCDLNATLVLNRTTEMEKKVSFDEEFASRATLPFFPTQTFNFDDKIRSPDFFKPVDESQHKVLASKIKLPFTNTCPDSKSSESPLYKTESSPKYASTPKHETNYTFTLDEDFLKSEQNFSPVTHLDKTTVKCVKGKTVFPENIQQPDHDNILPSETHINLSSDTDGKNILNITQNVEKLINYYKLNKTTVIQYNVEPYQENILPSETCTKLSSDIDEKNIFDVTHSTEEHGHEEPLYEHNKTFANFALNTTMSLSKGSEETVEKSQNKLDKTQTLNTTYEKEDQLTELPKIKSVSKVSKQHEVKGTKNTQKSKIAKHIDRSPSSFTASNSKFSDKKKARKSMSVQSINDNRDILNKNRRKTFGSKSSFNDSILSRNQKLSPNFDEKQDNTHCGAILKTEASFVRSPKKISCDKSKYLIKEGTGIESMKTKHKLIKSAVKISTSIPKPSSRQTKESKPLLQEKQKFSLDKTINLTKSALDTEKRSFEKSKVPSKSLSAAECKISSNPSSLMSRPCLSKIEESQVQEEEYKFQEEEEEESKVQEDETMSYDKCFRKLNQPLVHEKFEIPPLMPGSSSGQSEVSQSALQEEHDFLLIRKVNESAPDTEKRALVKSKVFSKRLSAAKCESKISSTSSSLGPRPYASKIEEFESAVQEEKKFSLHEAKKPIQSGKTLEKPKILPRRFSEVKSEIPRVTKYELPRPVFTAKSSLPISKKKTAVKSALNIRNETVRQSGLHEKRVLSTRNQEEMSSGCDLPLCTFPAPPKITRRQSSASKPSPSDAAPSQNVTDVKVPPVVQSHIPLSATRKKKDDADKNRKKNNLR